MTIQELKNMEGYKFECNISLDDLYDFINHTDNDYTYFDEWGSAYVWFGNQNKGVEYNLCIDNTVGDYANCSAIYVMFENDKKIMETDYSTYQHYEIDFTNEYWKEDLEDALCEAVIDFFFC